MKKYILIELAVGLALLFLVPAVLIADFAIEFRQREKDAERAGYTGYLVDFIGYSEMDDGEWFTCVEAEGSGKEFFIDEGGLSIRNHYKVYVMENSAEEKITAGGYPCTVYRDHYGIWVTPPPYYLAVIAGILIDIVIVLPVTLVGLVIVVIVYKIRNRSGNKIA